jgi:hypothetical protein
VNDPFAAYAHSVQPRREAPPKLTGPIATRGEARRVYSKIVAELNGCEDRDTLDIYLMTIGEQIIQFEAELDFLWAGDGEDFPGLHGEIQQAKSRVSDA